MIACAYTKTADSYGKPARGLAVNLLQQNSIRAHRRRLAPQPGNGIIQRCAIGKNPGRASRGIKKGDPFEAARRSFVNPDRTWADGGPGRANHDGAVARAGRDKDGGNQNSKEVFHFHK